MRPHRSTWSKKYLEGPLIMSEQDAIDEIGAELTAGNFEKALKLSQAAELEGHTSWYTKYSQGVCYRWLGHFEKAMMHTKHLLP